MGVSTLGRPSTVILQDRNAGNHRTVAPRQIRRWSVHVVVEAVQDERSGGESAIETPGAETAVGCGRRDSN